ncbi:LysR family transcriptional regulator [Gammaproteobacteria bacterium LSUCC0057]|uniref:LysR family transcriptional regulator n=1 Tax=Gammaproteobacteria bacterium LSUCC0057 TaxID=2559237 RepID=A0A4Y8UHY2_9GAMM|nr:LysR family transcriptional regulator [Gammaproteobacteria bacterium LSUCC0057]
MNLQRLSRLDLNLLVALQALLEERSVTRAAERLFVTQPAMSRILQRLRDQLGDPLFTRRGNTLVATPRAEELARHLPQLLDGILAMVALDDFDPATFEGEVAVAIPEFFAFELAPHITERLSRTAPGLTLAISSDTDSSVEEELASGVLDFAIDLDREFGDELVTQPLTQVTPAIWMRSEHPLASKEELKLADLLAYPFVQYYLLIAKRVSASTSARFDRTLAEMGLKRRKALVTNQLMTAMETVQRSNALMVATQYGLSHEREFFSIAQRPFPADLPHQGNIPFVLVQHRRTSHSAVHSWLSAMILQAVKEMDKELAKPW